MIFLVKVELQESQRKKTKKQADAAFVSLVVQFQQAMKISSLWVAGNPLLPREQCFFLQFGNSGKMISFKVFPVQGFDSFQPGISLLISHFLSLPSGFHVCCLNSIWPGCVTIPGFEGTPLHFCYWRQLRCTQAWRASSTLLSSRYMWKWQIITWCFTWTQPRGEVPRCGVQAPILADHSLCRLTWSHCCAAAWLCLGWRLHWIFLRGATQKYLSQTEKKMLEASQGRG